MADVKVPVSGDNAVLLLAAAEKAGKSADVVRTTSDGHFLVDEAVAKEAGVDYEGKKNGEAETKPVKKAAAKTAQAKE